MRAFFIPIEYLVMLTIMVMSVIVFVVVMVLMPVDVATLNRERMSRFLHYIMSLTL